MNEKSFLLGTVGCWLFLCLGQSEQHRADVYKSTVCRQYVNITEGALTTGNVETSDP